MIAVVSGVPRSGTSMMMQMLRAGGMPVLTDGVRSADAFNPRGYFEYDPVKRGGEDGAWLPRAEGRAVKVVSWHLARVAADPRCRVIWMERDLSAVVASQKRMLGDASQPADALAPALAAHLREVTNWLARSDAPAHLRVDYDDCLERPLDTARRVNMFLGGRLRVRRMAAAVDAKLRHCDASGPGVGAPEGTADGRAVLEKQLRGLGYL
jgi:hypothetical protein